MDYEEIKAEDLVLNERFQQYCLGLTESDQQYWENWLAEHPQSKAEFQRAKELFFILNGNHAATNFKTDRAVFLERLRKEGLLKEEPAEAKVIELPSSAGGRTKSRLVRYGVAAIFIGCVALGSILIYKNSNSKRTLGERPVKEVQPLDRNPGGNKAILTLADGTTILLDSASNGLLSQQGSTKIIKVGDVLTYKKGNQGTEVLFNTVATPKGGQYQLVLSDGSKVWLNAASSLRFPSAFKGGERTVELQGEGYFEVAHNPTQPFHVKINDVEVEVLGTHFNVMGYADEGLLKTTLVEGKVKVRKGSALVVLQPGQQAKVYQEGNIQLDKNPDMEEALAWKNGLFQFSGTDISAVLRQIERWYNIQTVIKGDMRNVHLSGTVSRNLNLSQVIKVLEESGVDIRSEGNKYVASPRP